MRTESGYRMNKQLRRTASKKLGSIRSTLASALSLAAKAGFALLITTALIVQAQYAAAQTDFNIRAESAELRAEFQNELDKWMLRAYEGDRDAQFKVGVLFANDQFGPPDHEQSVYWYTQAARQGHVLAQYNLGHSYITGLGIKRDEKIAMQWWLKAAEQQHALAQFNVGRAYYLGIGLDKDLSQSKLWFERASQNKEPKSTEILKQLGWWDQSSVALVKQPEPPKQPEQPIKPIPRPANTDTSQAYTVASAAAPTNNQKPGKPIAVFTNPAVRSVLISIIDNASTLQTVSEDKPWAVVTNTGGFPVWVNKNFISADGSNGVVTANSVNARSVPLITTGSVVGRLNKGEPVTIIDQRGDWYRINSPEYFKGWVKINDFAAATNTTADSETADNQISGNQTPGNENPDNDKPAETSTKVNATIEPSLAKPEKPGSSQVATKELDLRLDNNQWLFKQKEEHFALQLASFSDPTSTQRFINQLSFRDSSDLQLFTTTTSEGVNWTYVIYGNFANNDDAKRARTELKQKQAWIRRFGVLQQNRCIAWKKELPTPKELSVLY